ncbi:ribosomal RNA small subunit methyltransferase A [Brachybacterium saurashtrense]|uniref:23S ribosomal RNA methyltransferase Erm n=1 Tax=Brachybacterium saurashtrense TaxID=556288 RepID=A0A345YK64_9MICO|nr:rRNA adenine N(6)-methyltransferase family protein [Brachybacterium saurashtrense]AXK44316.1 23S ribosomal RNA methyltransferase Erm [Brachybacterium saurashtrense]RRR21352.1 23S ribosomal RNA methyltransferase Erm [Brachybacterium saurashtrense]RRR22927.1 23S ribosomal RNA methyltransferase Erm [Brachybacterium saurashtrense]
MPRTLHHPRPGAHELGQNYLRDPRMVRRVVELAGRTCGPLVEWGAGDGSLTLPLAALGRPLEAVEIDERNVARLSRRVPAHVTVRCADILRHAPSAGSTLVANLPFHLTTPAVKHLLRSRGWVDALLITQWEVARKRSGVGGATMLTAQWAPWFESRLEGRIPADSFRPRPTVDAGLLVLHRREHPLLPARRRPVHHDLVRRVFTGPGRGLEQILRRAEVPAPVISSFLDRHGYDRRALPRDVDPAHWTELLAPERGRADGARRRRG